MSAPRVQEALDEYLLSCKSRGDSPNTIRTKRAAGDQLLTEVGNIFVKNITARHVDSLFLSFQSRGLKASTMNLHRTILMHFFKWCQTRGYVSRLSSPMDGTRKLKDVPVQRLQVPAAKFPHLLDCAEHPRDRMVVALGLYLFLRQSEMRHLKIQDVNLDDGLLEVVVEKTRQRDTMPISSELDRELRRWFTAYSTEAGPLQGNWFLIPARTAPRFKGSPGHKGLVCTSLGGITPTRGMVKLETIPQRALERAGYSLCHDDGESRREGVHTLRRSGARALYDQRLAMGYDGAIRDVQAMLHHESVEMTERYLGITLDIKRRNESIRGVPMFPGSDSSAMISLTDRLVAGE